MDTLKPKASFWLADLVISTTSWVRHCTWTTTATKLAAGNIGWNDTASFADSAPGTRKDRELYVQAPVLPGWQNETYTSSCSEVAAAYGASVEDFQVWNPSTKENCTLSRDLQYCAVLSYETPSESTDTCSQYKLAEAGYNCNDMAARYGVEFEQFALWNPSLGEKFSDFRAGLVYCVKVWHFRQPGTLYLPMILAAAACVALS